MGMLLSNLVTRYPALGCALGIIGIVLLLLGGSQLRAFQTIQQNGIVTQGTVTRFTPDSEHAADMEYTYTVNGKQYIGVNSVGVKEQNGVAPGLKLEVRYLKEDPAQSVTGKSWPSTPYISMLCGGLLVLLPLAIARKRRRLQRQA